METISLKKDNNSVTFNSLIVHYMTLVWAIIEITPYLNSHVSTIIKLLVFAMWFFSLLTICPISKLINNPLFYIPSLFVLSKLAYMLIGMSNMTISFWLDGIRVYYIPLGMYVILQKFSYKRCYILFVELMIVFITNLISNISLFAADPYALYRASVGMNDTNVGNTIFVFLVSIMCLTLCVIYHNTQTRKKKILTFGIIVLCIWYLVFLNPRAISILILLTFIYLYICSIVIKKGNCASRLVKVLLICTSSILILINLSAILVLVSGSNMNSDLISRFTDVISIMNGKAVTNESSWYWRMRLYSFAIDTFFSSPASFLFGIGQQIFAESTISNMQALGISGHSEFFDTLAQFGVLGTYLLFCMFKKGFSYIKQYTSITFNNNALYIIFGYFFTYSIVNKSIDCGLFFCLFIIIPLYFRLLADEKRDNAYEQK